MLGWRTVSATPCKFPCKTGKPVKTCYCSMGEDLAKLNIANAIGRAQNLLKLMVSEAIGGAKLLVNVSISSAARATNY
nr:MAG TPA: hypothetical protein [Bacteriophage sp.]